MVEGRAFVFEKTSPSVWTHKAMLAPDDLSEFEYFGFAVALDQDRVVVGAPLHDLPEQFVGAAYVFDLVGTTWTQTAKLTPSDWPTLDLFPDSFGWSLDTQDGRLVIGAESANSPDVTWSGAAYLFEEGPDGWDEGTKFYASTPATGDSFGYAVAMSGSEVLIGAPHIQTAPGYPGRVFLVSLDPQGPSLLTDGGQVSLSAGGAQGFQLGACTSHAGDVYVFAGTASGPSPGFALGGVAVPLNLDAYFLFTTSNLGAPPLVAGLGILDASGRAEAAFQLPAGVLQPALAGVVLHHAYAVLDGATLQLEAVSGAVPVELVP
jgi:hypothetical protein